MWSAILLRDGEAVTGPVPCDQWDAAGIAGPLFVAMLGGPISIGQAVASTRVPDPEQLTLGEVA